MIFRNPTNQNATRELEQIFCILECLPERARHSTYIHYRTVLMVDWSAGILLPPSSSLMRSDMSLLPRERRVVSDNWRPAGPGLARGQFWSDNN